MEQEPNNRRSFTAPVVTLLCAVVLAGGSCYGFVSTLRINGSGKHAALSGFFAIVFVSNVIAVPGAIIWMIARAIRNSKAGNEGGR